MIRIAAGRTLEVEGLVEASLDGLLSDAEAAPTPAQDQIDALGFGICLPVGVGGHAGRLPPVEFDREIAKAREPQQDFIGGFALPGVEVAERHDRRVEAVDVGGQFHDLRGTNSDVLILFDAGAVVGVEVTRDQADGAEGGVEVEARKALAAVVVGVLDSLGESGEAVLREVGAQDRQPTHDQESAAPESRLAMPERVVAGPPTRGDQDLTGASGPDFLQGDDVGRGVVFGAGDEALADGPHADLPMTGQSRRESPDIERQNTEAHGRGNPSILPSNPEARPARGIASGARR